MERCATVGSGVQHWCGSEGGGAAVREVAGGGRAWRCGGAAARAVAGALAGRQACLYWGRVREIEKGKREPRRRPLLGPAAPCAMARRCRAVICGAAGLGHVTGRYHGGSLAAPPCMAQ